MKFYIASSSRFGNECGELAQAIESKGFGLGWSITRKWWKHYTIGKYDDKTDVEYFALSQVKMVRQLDFRAVDEADVVIIVCNYMEDHKVRGIVTEWRAFNDRMDKGLSFEMFENMTKLLTTHAPLSGALIEAGYAMAKNKIVIFMGRMKRSAMVSGAIHVKDQQELFKEILSLAIWDDNK